MNNFIEPNAQNCDIISLMKSDIDNLYKILGRNYFERVKNDNFAADSEIIEQIKSIYAQLDDYESKIVNVVNFDTCKYCNFPILQGSRFCSECGQDLLYVHQEVLPVQQEVEVQAVIYNKANEETLTMLCPSCNSFHDSETVFCTICGTKVIERPQVASLNVESMSCPDCSNLIEEGDIFCSNCGKDLRSIAQEKAKQEKICPSCKAKLRGECEFCTSCGVKV